MSKKHGKKTSKRQVKKAKKVLKKAGAAGPSTLKGALKAIDRMLGSSYGGLLANVLAATRGPDNEDGHLKLNTTSVIRAVAFPKNGSQLGSTHYGKKSVDFGQYSPTNTHFDSHMKWAAAALGLQVTRSGQRVY